MPIAPRSRPKLSREDTLALLRTHAVSQRVALVGIRGYYRDSMGAPGRNDRGIYDDAIFLCSEHVFASFNANTDPSVARRGIATLVPGVHLYRLGRHGISRGGGYPALRPATPGEQLPVTRDGIVNPKPGVAINIHRGSRNSTSSLGCQTIFPDQWPSFIALVTSEMKRAEQKTIPYLLIDEEARR